MYSWARFEIFAWGGETPGAVVQEWTHDRTRKWTPPPTSDPHDPLVGIVHILHWIMGNKRPRTKIVLFTNLTWLIALIREQPVVFPEFREGEQGNPVTTWDLAGRLDAIVYTMRSVFWLLRSYNLTVRPVLLEHHLYYDIPFASSKIQVARIGTDSISSAPLVDEIMDDPRRKTYVEGKYIHRN